MKAIIPTLMSDIQRLEKPSDIIEYILQWYTHSPKNINDTFHDHEISFRYSDALVGYNKELMCQTVKSDLETTLTKYFKNDTLDVEVTTEDVDVVRYNLLISILAIVDDVPYSINKNYHVDADNHLIYEFVG